jgi:hypothetical protein
LAALDALNTAAWSPIAGRSARDINFENSVHERNRRVNASLENPALAPGDGQWDAFWGGVDRTRDAAADEGKGFGINFAGFGRPSTGVSAMPSASSALMARAGVDDPWEGAGSQQGYQSRRLGFNRDVNNYRDELVHQLEAGDPNVMAQKAREQADVQNAGLERLQQGTDQRAIDTFGRTESLRMNQGRERVRDAAELLPFTPAYAAALSREQGVDRHEQHERARRGNCG